MNTYKEIMIYAVYEQRSQSGWHVASFYSKEDAENLKKVLEDINDKRNDKQDKIYIREEKTYITNEEKDAF